ncbi:hypothetical protein HanXRQr2_Chr13g0614141 [Helianthus annuus]|uniref:Uncharacterized protein n=1 Tax=Helianthus annuus TaxID=4232 RepID=A0A9K3EKR4_HELAN|nr:hypothetical protein HanXRQr2_Chr13g0614141 [Helianthus annuus]
MRATINMQQNRITSHIRLNPSFSHFIKHLTCTFNRPLKPFLRMQTNPPTHPIQNHIIRNHIRLNPTRHHLVKKPLRHLPILNLPPPVNQNRVHLHIRLKPPPFPLIKHLRRHFRVPVFTQCIKQITKIINLLLHLFLVNIIVDHIVNETTDIIESPNRLFR